MKVCLPTYGDRGLDEKICEHFGRAPTFTIVDTDTWKADVIDNVSEHMGGTGKPPEQIIKTGARVLICSGLGPRAINILSQNGISIYICASGTVREAIALWQAGKLTPASESNACKEHRH